MKKVENDWEAKYHEMEMRYRDLERKLMEDYTPSVTINTNAEIIKRLDIIGNLLGSYIRAEELQRSKIRLDEVKSEFERLTYDYNTREYNYSNRYEDELKWMGECK